MGRLQLYARKSDLTRIVLRVNGEKITFNLYEEVRIQSNNVNKDILAQPRLYGFLGEVHARLVQKMETAEAEKNKVYAKMYIHFKEQKGDSGRNLSDDYAKAKAESSSKYQIAVRYWINSKYEVKRILNCLEAFKQRKDLIQSLSSNLRNNV